MLHKIRFRSAVHFLSIILVVTFGCKSTSSEEPSISDLDKERLLGLMEDWYLWNDRLPNNSNPDDFSDEQEIVDQLRFSSFDRWSSVSEAARYNSYYEEGTYFGYGFSYAYNNDDELRIRYVYDESPFANAGVQRGWLLTHIDGVNTQAITDWNAAFGDDTPGTTQEFTFIDENGTTQQLSITKDVVGINAVMHADTLTVGIETIGYLVFNNFIEPAREELDAAFNLFELTNIDRLILDLRYNGGGRIGVATYLANYLISSSQNGQVLYRFVHNSDKTSNNRAQTLRKQGTLNIKELIVLTTEGTASASELLINGLKPLVPITHIGTSNTYGKPVGSYSWYSLEETMVYSLISFKFLNNLGNGEFFDGIEPDYLACDDLTTTWGIRTESMLSSAIEYLETGSPSECSVQVKSKFENSKLVTEEFPPAAIIN
jgi:C-terminal processing protease CtpA/Prc